MIVLQTMLDAQILKAENIRDKFNKRLGAYHYWDGYLTALKHLKELTLISE